MTMTMTRKEIRMAALVVAGNLPITTKEDALATLDDARVLVVRYLFAERFDLDGNNSSSKDES